MRLVTDYTHLNKFVKRPVHPFPCTAEILQAIPSSATCFAKLDAVHGYFQLALEPKSSFITTILLQQGQFQYLRAQMGLNASSDEWCCKSDIIVEGLPWARKLVDDTIIWADNEEDLVIISYLVLCISLGTLHYHCLLSISCTLPHQKSSLSRIMKYRISSQ